MLVTFGHVYSTIRKPSCLLEESLTVKEAAAYLGVSPNTLRNWGREGKVPEPRSLREFDTTTFPSHLHRRKRPSPVLTATRLRTRWPKRSHKALRVSRLIQQGIPTSTWGSVQTVRERWMGFQPDNRISSEIVGESSSLRASLRHSFMVTFLR